MQVKQSLDARGLNCPLPTLRTKKTLKAMQTGDTLKDMVAFCNQTGHARLASIQAGSNFEFLSRKAHGGAQ